MSRTLAPLLGLLAGCSSMALDRAPNEAGVDVMVPGTILVNVYPGDHGLLPQTFEVAPADDGAYAAAISLADTVTVSGTLTADVAHAWSAAGAPSSPEPFVGTIELSRPGTIQNATAFSDDAGAFSLEIPAGADYDLLLTPSDATIMAARSLTAQSYYQNRDVTQEFDDGAPLFGRITSNGVGVTKAPLVLTQLAPDPQVASTTFYTDDDGWYTARLPVAGSYSLAVVGGLSGAGVTLPTVEQRITTGSDGTKLDLDVGTIAAAVVTGVVLDASGAAVPDATIRLTSTRLDGEGTLEVESATDDHGAWSARLVSGDYTLEVLPTYEQALTPSSMAISARAGSTDLPAITLTGWQTVTGVVNLPDGGPAADVTVTATQDGWSGFAYTATTDAKGTYSLELPAVDYTLACSPPTSTGAALTRVELPVGGDPSVSLVSGQVIDGAVESTSGVTPYAVVEIWDGASNLLLGQAITGTDGTFKVVIDPPMIPSGDTADGSDSADTGSDTGADTGKDTGSDTGDTDTGSDTGGTDTGTDTADSGV